MIDQAWTKLLPFALAVSLPGIFGCGRVASGFGAGADAGDDGGDGTGDDDGDGIPGDGDGMTGDGDDDSGDGDDDGGDGDDDDGGGFTSTICDFGGPSP